jgi:hypothetical protein
MLRVGKKQAKPPLLLLLLLRSKLCTVRPQGARCGG